MMTLKMTKATVLALLLAVSPAALAAQGAADAQAVDQPAPNWPPGVENWDSKKRDPANVNPDAAEKRGLTAPEVQENAPPPPEEQGVRAPRPLLGPEEQEQMSLYEMLNLVRGAPPGLDGKAVQRPNALGSEPTTEMQPIGGPDDLFPEGYVE
ncbi:hypothetical protein [Caenispirillum salinarum]|uniref:hypothetical protein n=1 Tax=Caenispirillum salinarum TaxID=859058 RepID=UPI00384A4982